MKPRKKIIKIQQNRLNKLICFEPCKGLKNIQIIEDKKVEYLDYENNPKVGGQHSGYYLQYYIGEMQIKGSKVSMKVNLNKKIIDLALKEAGGEIKELVKKEYEEFENQLYA